MSFAITWPGTFGRQYTFETYPIGTAFNKVGGVYIFCKPATNGKWNAVYVGETGDFNERLNTALQRHQAWSTCRLHGATHISVMIVRGTLQQRLNIETELRHSLRPPVNRQSA